jgi:hypothetical protein
MLSSTWIIVIIKFLLILATSLLGLWEEIRKRLLKVRKSQERKNNKIYVLMLILLLIGTLVLESLNTNKEIRESNEAKLKADSARKIAFETDSLTRLAKDSLHITLDSLRAALALSNKLSRLSGGISDNLDKLANKQHLSFLRLQYPIWSVRISYQMEFDSLLQYHPKFDEQLRNFIAHTLKEHGSIYGYLNGFGLKMLDDHHDTVFKFSDWKAFAQLQDDLVNELKQVGGTLYFYDPIARAAMLSYHFCTVQDSATYQSVYKKWKVDRTRTDPLTGIPEAWDFHTRPKDLRIEHPRPEDIIFSPSNARIIYNFSKHSLFISQKATIVKKDIDNKRFVSPYDFKDEDRIRNIQVGVFLHSLDDSLEFGRYPTLRQLSIAFNRSIQWTNEDDSLSFSFTVSKINHVLEEVPSGSDWQVMGRTIRWIVRNPFRK